MDIVRFCGRYKLLANGKSITDTRQHHQTIVNARQKIEQQDGGFAQIHVTPEDVFVTTGTDTRNFIYQYGGSMAYLSQFTYPQFKAAFTEGLDFYTGSMVWQAYEKQSGFRQEQADQLARQHKYFFENATPVEVTQADRKRWRFLG